MKIRSIIATVAVILIIIGSNSCYKDVISPGSDPNGPPMDVSYSGDLAPLFNDNCASSGCHDGVAHAPDLRTNESYNALLSGGYVNTIVPATSIIYTEVKSGSMPPAGPLTARQSALILDWIRNGAPNN
jgi:hypothetical protein